MARAVVVHVDGTLIDSNDVHARTWADALAMHGFEVPFERIRPRIGMGGHTLLLEITGIPGRSPAGRRILRTREWIFRTRLPGLVPTRGAAALLDRLMESGTRVAAASTVPARDLEHMIEMIEPRHLARLRLLADGAGRLAGSDPVPGALAALDLPASALTLVAGTPYTIAAGLRAGARVVALRCGGWNPPSGTDSMFAYDDPEHLCAEFDRSPLAIESDVPEPRTSRVRTVA